jgi:hypothetical protein
MTHGQIQTGAKGKAIYDERGPAQNAGAPQSSAAPRGSG